MDSLELSRMLRLVVVLPFFVLLTGCGGWAFSYASHKDHRAPLEKAAQEGDAAEVKRLLASGADPNDRGGVFGSPLNSAVLRKGNVEIVRMLVAAGANPSGRAQEGNACWTPPLLSAASRGDIEITRALLDAGASIKQSGRTKLIVGFLKASIVDLMVKHGLDLYVVDDNGRNALHDALAPPVVPPLEGIEYLVRAGVPLNARDRSDKTPLAYWREPRDYEVHWLRMWLMERLSGDSFLQRERENRAKISALLERSGALL